MFCGQIFIKVGPRNLSLKFGQAAVDNFNVNLGRSTVTIAKVTKINVAFLLNVVQETYIHR